MFILLTALSIPAEVVQRSGGNVEGWLEHQHYPQNSLPYRRIQKNHMSNIIQYVAIRQSHIDWLGYTCPIAKRTKNS